MVLRWAGLHGCFEGVISNEGTFGLCDILHACCGELAFDVFEGKAPTACHSTAWTCNAPVAKEMRNLICALELNYFIHAGPANDVRRD